MEVIFFIVGLVALILSAWVLVLQTEKKKRLVAGLVLLWVLATAARDGYDFFKDRPRPYLILDQIDQVYDANPPTSVGFSVKIRNTGDNPATKVSTKQVWYLDDQVLYEETTEQQDIDPGQVVQLKARFQGETFKKAWNDEALLKFELLIFYSDKSDTEFSADSLAEYKPRSHEPVLGPGWTILKNQ